MLTEPRQGRKQQSARMAQHSHQFSFASRGIIVLMNEAFTLENVNAKGYSPSLQVTPYRHQIVCSPPFSNRHNLGLEIRVSYRKQRIGPLSNRHKIAKCILANQRNDI